MAQVQFRSDDSSVWSPKYGKGSDGVLTVSANTTDSPTKTAFTGTSGALTGTVGDATGFVVGDIVIIHQSRNGGSEVGRWMLNYIVGISGTTFTFVYALVGNFDTTAQIQKIPQYSAITISATLTSSAWDGTTGGILALFSAGSINITGAITANGKGYRGGGDPGSGQTKGLQGEGTLAAGGTKSNSANGSGGSGGDEVGGGGVGGAGGGNGAAGSGAGGGGGTSNGGSTSGNANLIVATFGGAGGSGGTNNNGGTRGDGIGGPGGGFILLAGRRITITGSLASSGNGGTDTANSNAGGGGGGAGGSTLLKGQTVVLGSSLVTAIAGVGGLGGASGVPGGAGRIHADYSTSLSGNTNPVLDSRQDSSLLDQSGIQII